MENNGKVAVHTIYRSPNTDPSYLRSFEEELCEFISLGYKVAGAGMNGYTVYAIVFKSLVDEEKQEVAKQWVLNGIQPTEIKRSLEESQTLAKKEINQSDPK
jgi:hypothetical protein